MTAFSNLPPPPFSGLKFLLGWPGIASVAVIVAIALSRFIRRKSDEYEKQLRYEIAKAVIDVAVQSEAKRNQYLAEAEAALFHNGDFHSPEFASILRVESEYAKVKDGKYNFKIVVLLKKIAGSATASTIESEMSYEDLPDAVRSEMIKTRRDKIVVLHYPHKDGGK